MHKRIKPTKHLKTSLLGFGKRAARPRPLPNPRVLPDWFYSIVDCFMTLRTTFASRILNLLCSDSVLLGPCIPFVIADRYTVLERR